MISVDLASDACACTADCDPPYTENLVRQKKAKKLVKELKKTNEDLRLAKNVLLDTQNNIAAFRRVLRSELGYDVDPNVRIVPTRKERIREKSCLKSVLIHLVDYLREHDQRIRHNPSCHPVRFSASTEDLMSRKQDATLRKLYQGCTVLNTSYGKGVSASLKEYLELKDCYVNRLYANKVMENEISTTKKRITELQEQYLEDKKLIDFISSHHLKMKETFADIGEHSDESDDDTSVDSEIWKYRKLWEESKAEKNRLVQSLKHMENELEILNRKITRSENFCSDNIVAFRSLSDKIRNGIILSKLVTTKQYNFGKYSVIEYRSQKNQLVAAVEENKYLRNFLQEAILSKADDIGELKDSLKLTAEKYRSTLEEIRNKPSTK